METSLACERILRAKSLQTHRGDHRPRPAGSNMPWRSVPPTLDGIRA